MDSIYSDVEFKDNPEQRCPCVLLLDTSYSMSGQPIDALNNGLTVFQSDLAEDTFASRRVEVAIVTFGGIVDIVQDFVVARDFSPPRLVANGGTPMGEAINTALNLIAKRKQVYKDNRIDYFRPWIFLITDGAPTDEWRQAAQRIHDEAERKKVTVFTVGVEDADFTTLQQISPRPPVKLQGLKFKEMFEWLSSSMNYVSSTDQYMDNQDIPLQAPTDWAEWMHT